MTVPAVPSRRSQQCFAVLTDEPAKRVKLAATRDDCVVGSNMEVCDDLLGYVRCSVVNRALEKVIRSYASSRTDLAANQDHTAPNAVTECSAQVH